jgi:hypothetical protein
MSVAPSKLAPGAPASLQIRFAEGERPHLFWVSDGAVPAGATAAHVFKVLSKALPGGNVEAVLLEEDGQGRRRELARVEVPREHPAGSLARWVDTLSEELDVRFRLYDLRSVRSPEEWAIVAGQLGWLRPA